MISTIQHILSNKLRGQESLKYSAKFIEDKCQLEIKCIIHYLN
jgi:hypothetical protein